MLHVSWPSQHACCAHAGKSGWWAVTPFQFAVCIGTTIANHIVGGQAIKVRPVNHCIFAEALGISLTGRHFREISPSMQLLQPARSGLGAKDYTFGLLSLFMASPVFEKLANAAARALVRPCCLLMQQCSVSPSADFRPPLAPVRQSLPLGCDCANQSQGKRNADIKASARRQEKGLPVHVMQQQRCPAQCFADFRILRLYLCVARP